MSETIITDTSSKAFEEAKAFSSPAIVNIDKVLREGIDSSTRLKAELLVKKEIEKELITIKDEQFQITKRKAEELMVSGLNLDSDLWPRASIHPRAYYRWEMAYPHCWEDKQFFDEYLRDNPEADLRKYIKVNSNTKMSKYVQI